MFLTKTESSAARFLLGPKVEHPGGPGVVVGPELLSGQTGVCVSTLDLPAPVPGGSGAQEGACGPTSIQAVLCHWRVTVNHSW